MGHKQRKAITGQPKPMRFPKSAPIPVEAPSKTNEEQGLDKEDLGFLSNYMAPTYLTPGTLARIAEKFIDLSSVTLWTGFFQLNSPLEYENTSKTNKQPSFPELARKLRRGLGRSQNLFTRIDSCISALSGVKRLQNNTGAP